MNIPITFIKLYKYIYSLTYKEIIIIGQNCLFTRCTEIFINDCSYFS